MAEEEGESEEDEQVQYDMMKAEQELEDEARMEKMRNDQEDQAEDQAAYGYPSVKEKPNVFSFLGKVIERKDTTKTANLMKHELGFPKINVRGWQDMAQYARYEGLDEVGKYCMAQGEIILATSLSRDGFLATLAVSQRKEITRGRPMMGDGTPMGGAESRAKQTWNPFRRSVVV
jgi:hypothetical protein